MSTIAALPAHGGGRVDMCTDDPFVLTARASRASKSVLPSTNINAGAKNQAEEKANLMARLQERKDRRRSYRRFDDVENGDDGKHEKNKRSGGGGRVLVVGNAVNDVVAWRLVPIRRLP